MYLNACQIPVIYKIFFVLWTLNGISISCNGSDENDLISSEKYHHVFA